MIDPHANAAPRVSVIMATYNWAPVLPYSIGSVLDQTLADFELLVVGDGCTDESEAVVTAIGDSRVRWVNLPANTGHQAGPNNEGLRRSSGDVVAFCGHDDLWLPHHLATLVPVVAAGRGAAYSRWCDVHPHWGPRILPSTGRSYQTGDWIPPTATVFSRQVMLDAGGWRPPSATGTMDPETELLARVCELAGPPGAVERVTCVKLPASARRDVYRERPHHEQARWLETIRGADDPEAAVQAEVDADADAGVPPPSRRSLLGRAGRRLGRLVRRWGLRPRPETALDRYARARRFKGL